MKTLVGFALAAITVPVFGRAGQILSGRHGTPTLEISNVEVASRDGPWVVLSVTVRNISGADLTDVVLNVTYVGKDGLKTTAKAGDGVQGLPVCYSAYGGMPPSCDGAHGILKKGSTLTPIKAFKCSENTCTDKFEFSLNPNWQSPEDLKIRAAKQKSDTERYARLKAEEAARASAARANEEAKAEAERARVRAACAAIYKSTADRKVSDLTVKEEQQVRACQGLGLYSDR